jgi:hypothetical protein
MAISFRRVSGLPELLAAKDVRSGNSRIQFDCLSQVIHGFARRRLRGQPFAG